MRRGRRDDSCSSRMTLRVRPLLQRRREPDALVHPARAVGRAPPARAGRGVPRGVGRLRAHQPLLRRCGRCRIGQQGRRGGSLPRLPPLSRAALRPRRAPGCAPRALRAHPVAVPTGRCCPSRCAAPSTRGCSRTTWSRSTPQRWARNFAASCADSTGGVAAGRVSRTTRSRWTSASSRNWARVTRCVWRTRRCRGPRS